jgi:hypothetical protein
MGLRRVLRVTLPAALALAVVIDPTIVASQGELILHKDGTSLYHRPHCPVVSGVTGVVAMTVAQAKARGYEPHADCDPNNPNAPAPKGAAPPPETVYLDGSKYYHRKTCKRIDEEKAKAAALEVVGKSHWPCPSCNPPVRRRSLENAVPGTKRGGR